MSRRTKCSINRRAAACLLAGWLLHAGSPLAAQNYLPQPVRIERQEQQPQTGLPIAPRSSLKQPPPAARVSFQPPPPIELPPPAAVAPDRGAFGLEDLSALAEQQSPLLAQAAAEVEAARGRTRQAGLYPNPVAQGGAMQLGGSESQYYAQLSQEIVTRHKLQLDQAAASQEVAQAELRFVRTRFELLTNVRQGFATVLAADRRVAVLEQLVDLAKKSADTANRLFRAGDGERPDALLFEIELEKAEVALENAKVSGMGGRRQLAATVGRRELVLARVNGNLAMPMDRVAQEIVIDDYVPMNASVLIADIEVERARLLARRAEVEPFPNVTIMGGYMRQLEGVQDMGILALELPLPLWNKNQGNIDAARAEVGRAIHAASQSQNTVAHDMAAATARFRSADQRVKRYQERITPRAAEGVRLIQLGFQAGQFDFQRLLQAQRLLVESDLGYLEALEARWNAAAELAGLAQLEQFP
jgi:outer membrane protein, heavy metal efflux system